MKAKAFAVIDTNVIVSAMMSNGYPNDILRMVQDGNVIPVFDKRVLSEYYKVLSRKKFGFPSQDIYDTLHSVVSNGILINDVERAKEQFIDRDDIPFFEVKESSEELSSYLVTGNLKHFPESDSIVTSRELINIMKMFDRFLQKDFDYEKAVQELRSSQEATSKYTSGKEIIDKLFDEKKKTVKRDYLDR